MVPPLVAAGLAACASPAPVATPAPSATAAEQAYRRERQQVYAVRAQLERLEQRLVPFSGGPESALPGTEGHQGAPGGFGWLEPDRWVLAMFAPEDRRRGGRRYDDYFMELRRGDAITLVTRGDVSPEDGRATDTSLALLWNGRVVATDEDGVGNHDARVRFTASVSGWYIVRVFEQSPGARHSPYKLYVKLGDDPGAV